MTRALAVAASWMLLYGAAMTAIAEEKPKSGCSRPESRQFDFWVGVWQVTEQGKPAGVNRVELVLDGCALLENWSGATGSTGKSLNFYDAADGLWHQTWVDGSGGALFLSGKFENGTMRLEGERPASGDEPATRHRITWTPLPDGKLRQVWESSPAGKATWTVLFDGLYEAAR
jgi:hypothetical protein